LIHYWVSRTFFLLSTRAVVRRAGGTLQAWGEPQGCVQHAKTWNRQAALCGATYLEALPEIHRSQKHDQLTPSQMFGLAESSYN